MAPKLSSVAITVPLIVAPSAVVQERLVPGTGETGPLPPDIFMDKQVGVVTWWWALNGL